MQNTKLKKWIIAGAAVVILAAAGITFVWKSLTGKTYEGTSPVWVYIPQGSSEQQVADSLTACLGKAGEAAVRIWRLSRTDYGRAHGAYKFENGATSMDIYRTVSRGRQTPVRLTFNNLRTLPQLAGRVSSQLEADSAAFIMAADSVLGAEGIKEPERIGAFLPDTYEFYWSDSPAKVVSRLHSYQKAFWTPERVAKAKALGLTPAQVTTIASIAEEETNNATERAVVGRLYINRFQRGMRLQADPTVKFATGNFALRRITAKHLATESPYNTYRTDGLPPGPIRMPEGKTIDAILNSKPHNYLYMCAKEDMSGLHNFTASAQQHMNNAARYRAALNKRGIH